MPISLHPISAANWRAAADLRVRPDQEHFVSNNLYSIAEAQFGYDDPAEGYWALAPYAIYDENLMVGFAMTGRNPNGQRSQGFIVRLMIDATQQNKGYGRAALLLLIAEFERDPTVRAVGIGYNPNNTVARKLYASLGFVEIAGLIVDGENIAVRSMT